MFLDFCNQTTRSAIEPMKKIARTLSARRKLLLNISRPETSSPAVWWKG
jgi:hypothetical protein